MAPRALLSMKSAVAPWSSAFFWNAGSLSMARTSPSSLRTMASGVLAGANSANQDVAFTPGRPASAVVGTDARLGRRAWLVTASTFSLPAWMWGMKGGAVPKVRSTWPPSRSCSAGPVPL